MAPTNPSLITLIHFTLIHLISIYPVPINPSLSLTFFFFSRLVSDPAKLQLFSYLVLNTVIA
jgi:hypothetical protein